MKKLNMIVATAASAVAGTLIGILFAPDKGTSTRKKITRETDEYLKGLKKEIEALRHSLNEKAEVTRDEVDDLQNEAKSKGEDLLDKAKKLASYDEWTKDELYERAKELNIDSYSKMNKDELINALRGR